MRVLMVCTGYLPYLFSENLCNAKLVWAFEEAGIEVDVISRADEGPTYGAQWGQEWLPLKDKTYEVTFPVGNKVQRLADFAWSGARMGGYWVNSIRWARRAYELALRLIKQHHYDAVLTRSPNDIAHLVGYRLKKKTGIRWIANWNDPASPIWPEPYTHNHSRLTQWQQMRFTRRMLFGADVDTFPSESLRDHFISHFPTLKSHPIEVIPHIALSESLLKAPGNRPDADVLTICHSGNLSGERDPELMFQAMRRLIDSGRSRWRLDIMGHTTDRLKSLISQYGLGAHVDVIGSFDYLEAVRRLYAYDLLLLLEAKLQHGIFFASKLTDYALTGRPILALSPATGYAKDSITATEAGFVVDNTDIEAVTDTLCHVYDLWTNGQLPIDASQLLSSTYSPQAVVIRLIRSISDHS